MQKVLHWFGYNINIADGSKNKKINNFDYLLCVVYAIISIINVCMGSNTLNFVTENASGDLEINFNSFKTILLMIVNAIVLVRMNIRLHIETKDKEMEASKQLDERKRTCTKIKIRALDMRRQIIYYCYVIDILILIGNMFFIRNGISISLLILILIPIVVTLLNNLIDIAKDKYDADEQITYELNSMMGVHIDDD